MILREQDGGNHVKKVQDQSASQSEILLPCLVGKAPGRFVIVIMFIMANNRQKGKTCLQTEEQDQCAVAERTIQNADQQTEDQKQGKHKTRRCLFLFVNLSGASVPDPEEQLHK